MIMSANNMTLIKKFKGKFYVFENIVAESWTHYDEKTDTFDDSRRNELSLKEAEGVFPSFEEAYIFARELDNDNGSEYGVQVNVLVKDGAEVKIIP